VFAIDAGRGVGSVRFSSDFGVNDVRRQPRRRRDETLAGRRAGLRHREVVAASGTNENRQKLVGRRDFSGDPVRQERGNFRARTTGQQQLDDAPYRPALLNQRAAELSQAGRAHLLLKYFGCW